MLSKSKAILIVSTFAFLFVLSSFAILPASAATGKTSPSTAIVSMAIQPSKVTKFKCPDCWSGYGVNSTSSGSVTGVSATFKVASTTCGSSTTLSAMLVALDGTSSSDFSYAGVIIECYSGSAIYAAEWYNGADGSSGVASWTPNAGDSVTMNVSEASGTVSFTLTDNTQKATSTGSGSDSGMILTEATCFTDMASGYGQVNFGTQKFTDCAATVSGKTGPIGSFGKTAPLVEFITYNSSGKKPLNTVSKLSKKENFSVTFKSSGP